MRVHILYLVLAFRLIFTSQTHIYFCSYNFPRLSLSVLSAPILFKTTKNNQSTRYFYSLNCRNLVDQLTVNDSYGWMRSWNKYTRAHMEPSTILWQEDFFWWMFSFLLKKYIQDRLKIVLFLYILQNNTLCSLLFNTMWGLKPRPIFVSFPHVYSYVPVQQLSCWKVYFTLKSENRKFPKHFWFQNLLYFYFI